MPVALSWLVEQSPPEPERSRTVFDTGRMCVCVSMNRRTRTYGQISGTSRYMGASRLVNQWMPLASQSWVTIMCSTRRKGSKGCVDMNKPFGSFARIQGPFRHLALSMCHHVSPLNWWNHNKCSWPNSFWKASYHHIHVVCLKCIFLFIQNCLPNSGDGF